MVHIVDKADKRHDASSDVVDQWQLDCYQRSCDFQDACQKMVAVARPTSTVGLHDAMWRDQHELMLILQLLHANFTCGFWQLVGSVPLDPD